MSFFSPAKPIYLIGPSLHLPKRKVSNEDLVAWMGSGRPSWIEKRSGIRERHWVDDDQACSDLAVNVAKELFTAEKINPERIRQLILTTVSGDYPTPPTAPLVQDRLGLSAVGAFDLGAACAGFVTGLHVGAGLVYATGQDHLVISSEVRSKFLNREDFATAVLFGDGASAALVTDQAAGASFRYLGSQLFADGSVATMIHIAAGGSRLPTTKNRDEGKSYLKMEDSAALFFKAVEGMSEAASQFVKTIGMTLDKMTWVVPHQANLLLIREIARRLNIDSQKVCETIQHTGNTSGASVGIALAELRQSNRLKKGELILLLSAGGGGLAACSLLETL